MALTEKKLNETVIYTSRINFPNASQDKIISTLTTKNNFLPDYYTTLDDQVISLDKYGFYSIKIQVFPLSLDNSLLITDPILGAISNILLYANDEAASYQVVPVTGGSGAMSGKPINILPTGGVTSFDNKMSLLFPYDEVIVKVNSYTQNKLLLGGIQTFYDGAFTMFLTTTITYLSPL